MVVAMVELLAREQTDEGATFAFKRCAQLRISRAPAIPREEREEDTRFRRYAGGKERYGAFNEKYSVVSNIVASSWLPPRDSKCTWSI